MSTQTAVYTKITEKDATEITPIMGQTAPENINNLEDELTRVMATENTTLYNVGKKLDFW